MSSFFVVPFRLEQQDWFRVCVISVVSLTFSFATPFAWCHRWSITSSWNLSTKCVTIIVNLLISLKLWIESMMSNTTLAPYLKFLEYFMWSSTPTLTWSTILLLPRIMIVVFRTSTRTLERNAKCFLISYPNTVVWVTSWISSPRYLNDFCIGCPVIFIPPCFPLGRLYS